MTAPLLPLPPHDAVAPVRRTTSRSMLIGALVGGVVGAAIAGRALGSGLRVAKPLLQSAPSPAWVLPMMIGAFCTSMPMPNGSFVTDGMRFLPLAMRRRIPWSPVPSENLIFAAIDAANVSADQPPPVAPDAWWRPDQPPLPPAPDPLAAGRGDVSESA